MKENIIAHSFSLDQKQRSTHKNHKSFVIWFTGLSGSGKSTIANEVEKTLFNQNIHTYILDGDAVREGLSANLSFSPEDRSENIRRIAEVSKLMVDAGIVVLAAFVSPYIKDRENVKNIVSPDNYIEVFVDTPLEVCESRDVKGLYEKARKGEISNFTGVNAPYEPSKNPDLIIDTSKLSLDDSVKEVMAFVNSKLSISNE